MDWGTVLNWVDHVWFFIVFFLWMSFYLSFILSIYAENPGGYGRGRLLWAVGISIAYMIFVGLGFGDWRLAASKMLLAVGCAAGGVPVLALLYGVIVLGLSLIKREFDKACLLSFLQSFCLYVPFVVWVGIYEGLRMLGVTLNMMEIVW